MAKTFTESDGDIRAVMHTMIYSPEFWSREAYRAKIKTPFELVVSAARALGTDVDMPQPLVAGWGASANRFINASHRLAMPTRQTPG